VHATSPALSLFGVPVLRSQSGPEIVFTPERPFQLLAYLACRDGWVGRDELAAWMWPERPQSVARSNLRKVLLLAQRLPVAPPLDVQGGRVRWSPPSDLRDFEEACDAGRWQEALDLHRSRLLEGMDDGLSTAAAEWLAFERERVLNRWREAAMRRLEALAASPRDAAALAERLRLQDPEDESFVFVLARALRAQGRHEAARQTVQAHARRLAEILDTEPSAALRALAGGGGAKEAEALVRRLFGLEDEDT